MIMKILVPNFWGPSLKIFGANNVRSQIAIFRHYLNIVKVHVMSVRKWCCKLHRLAHTIT